MEVQSPYLAIDFGSQYLRMAVWGKNQLEEISLRGGYSVAAIVTYYSGGSYRVPRDFSPMSSIAYQTAALYARDILAIQYDSPIVEKLRSFGIGNIKPDSNGFAEYVMKFRKPEEEIHISPVDVCSILLKSLRDGAQLVSGLYEKAVITIPSSFSSNQRKAMKEAANKAGFTEVAFISSSVATGLHTIYDTFHEYVPVGLFGVVHIDYLYNEQCVLRCQENGISVEYVHETTNGSSLQCDKEIVDVFIQKSYEEDSSKQEEFQSRVRSSPDMYYYLRQCVNNTYANYKLGQNNSVDIGSLFEFEDEPCPCVLGSEEIVSITKPLDDISQQYYSNMCEKMSISSSNPFESLVLVGNGFKLPFRTLVFQGDKSTGSDSMKNRLYKHLTVDESNRNAVFGAVIFGIHLHRQSLSKPRPLSKELLSDHLKSEICYESNDGGVPSAFPFPSMLSTLSPSSIPNNQSNNASNQSNPNDLPSTASATSSSSLSSLSSAAALQSSVLPSFISPTSSFLTSSLSSLSSSSQNEAKAGQPSPGSPCSSHPHSTTSYSSAFGLSPCMNPFPSLPPFSPSILSTQSSLSMPSVLPGIHSDGSLSSLSTQSSSQRSSQSPSQSAQRMRMGSDPPRVPSPPAFSHARTTVEAVDAAHMSALSILQSSTSPASSEAKSSSARSGLSQLSLFPPDETSLVYPTMRCGVSLQSESPRSPPVIALSPSEEALSIGSLTLPPLDPAVLTAENPSHQIAHEPMIHSTPAVGEKLVPMETQELEPSIQDKAKEVIQPPSLITEPVPSKVDSVSLEVDISHDSTTSHQSDPLYLSARYSDSFTPSYSKLTTPSALMSAKSAAITNERMTVFLGLLSNCIVRFKCTILSIRFMQGKTSVERALFDTPVKFGEVIIRKVIPSTLNNTSTVRFSLIETNCFDSQISTCLGTIVYSLPEGDVPANQQNSLYFVFYLDQLGIWNTFVMNSASGIVLPLSYV